MNPKAKILFSDFSDSIDAFRVDTNSALSGYKKEMDIARSESKRFKDEREYYENAKRKALSEAKKQLKAAQTSITSDVNAIVHKLETLIADSALVLPEQSAIAALNMIHAYGIKPSKPMIQAILDRTGSSQIGLSALNNVLSSVGSRYRIEYADMAQLETDLNDIRKLARLAQGYSPIEQHVAACEVFAGQPITMYRSDGSTYQNGTLFDGLSLITYRVEFDTIAKRLPEIAARWTADVSNPVISELTEKDILELEQAIDTSEKYDRIDRMNGETPVQPESKTAITDQKIEQDAIANALEMGQETARVTSKPDIAAYVR